MSKKCFFIAPIGDEETFVRKRSDQVFFYIIEPAARECKYDEIARSDLISSPGIITNQIIDRLYNDELVIADLTWNNPNVIYELALRHAFRKPVIQIKDSEDILPFDISGMRTIKFDFRFFDSVKKCKEELVKQIKTTELDPNNVESPVTYIIDHHSLRKQDNDSKLILRLDSQIQTLSAEVNDLKRLKRQSADVSGFSLGYQLAPPPGFDPTVFSTLRKNDSIPPPPAPPPAPISRKKDEDEDKDK